MKPTIILERKKKELMRNVKLPGIKPPAKIVSAETKREFTHQYNLVIISALTVVAGLFWQDAFKSTLDAFLSQENSLIGKYVTSAIVTIVVALLVLRLAKE